jgi:hypothetical protein
LASARRWRAENKDRVRALNTENYLKNRQARILSAKQWRIDNPEKARESQAKSSKKYCEKNRSQRTAYARLYRQRPGPRLASNLRRRLYSALMGKSRSLSLLDLLGCSLDQLRKHIESQWSSGMSWDNYGLNGWHVDHIYPLSKLDLTDPEQLRRACHFSNLSPMWAELNRRKYNKVSVSCHSLT